MINTRNIERRLYLSRRAIELHIQILVSWITDFPLVPVQGCELLADVVFECVNLSIVLVLVDYFTV